MSTDSVGSLTVSSSELTDPIDRSLDHLLERSGLFGASFERHLQAEPCTDRLLPAGCTGRQLVRMLRALAVRRTDPAQFAVLCRRLAVRWRQRGACATHCDAAGAALLRSLREVLGSEYDEVEEHWAVLYGNAAEAMLVAVAWEGAGT